MRSERNNSQAEVDLIISVVNHNSKGVLRDCLQSVFNTIKQIKYNVYVVNNTPNDSCNEMLEVEFPLVKMITNSMPAGFATNHNKVLKLGGARYFLILNPDTAINLGTIDTMVQFMDTHPEIGVVGPRIFNSDGAPESLKQVRHPLVDLVYFASYISDIDISPMIAIAKKLLGKRSPTKAKSLDGPSATQTEEPDFYECDFLSGSCFLVRQEVIDQVGLMDERFFMYFEEADWEKRIQDAGWTLCLMPKINIIHIGGQSTHTSSLKYLHNLKTFFESSLFFYKKHYGFLMTSLMQVALVVVTLMNLARWPIVYLLKPDEKERAKYYFQFSYGLLHLLLFKPLLK